MVVPLKEKPWWANEREEYLLKKNKTQQLAGF
jgi:hypothetical protein